MMKLCENFNTG